MVDNRKIGRIHECLINLMLNQQKSEETKH